jgi:hypothetical protein
MSTALEKSATKTFWQKPEGKTGAVVAVGTAAGAGLLLYQALPYIIVLLQNTIYACLLGVAAIVVTSPIWSTKVRVLISYMFRNAMRAMTGFVIEIDPIGILKNYVEDMRKNRASMDGQIGNLRGHINELSGIISKNDANLKQSLKMAGQAEKQGMDSAFKLNARQAGRLKKSNLTLQTLLDRMTGLDKLLNKLRDTTDIMVQDCENEVELKQQERKAILAGYGAFTSALKVMKGDPDKRELFDQAMEYLAEDYSMKVGQIEDFMRTSQGFIQTVDLENGVFEQDALDALDKQLDLKAEQMLLSPMERRELPAATEAQRVPVAASTNEVGSLYDRKP